MKTLRSLGLLTVIVTFGCGGPSLDNENSESLTGSDGGCTTVNGVCVPTDDFTLWVKPHLLQIDKVRQVLMAPYTIGRGDYGYDATFGLVRGGNIEASGAIGVSAGYNDVIVLIDNNLEGSASLDFWNAYKGVTTSVEGNCRALLDVTAFDEIGGACPPFKTVKYDGTDRREAKLGTHSPYYAQLSKPGAVLHNTSGQTDYVHAYEGIGGASTSCVHPAVKTDEAHPLIVSALPVGSAIGSGGNLENDGPWIALQFEQGNVAGAKAEFTRVVAAWNGNTFGNYGGATRDLLHFIEVARATGFWRDAAINKQVLGEVITLVWQLAGSDGGLPQSYSGTTGGGSTNTPEPNFQAMIAFDPRVPTWF